MAVFSGWILTSRRKTISRGWPRNVESAEADDYAEARRRDRARVLFAYFQDIYDHTIRVVDTIDTYRDLLSGTLDAHLAVASNRLNEVVKVLTSVSIILMTDVMQSVPGLKDQGLRSAKCHPNKASLRDERSALEDERSALEDERSALEGTLTSAEQTFCTLTAPDFHSGDNHA